MFGFNGKDKQEERTRSSNGGRRSAIKVFRYGDAVLKVWENVGVLGVPFQKFSVHRITRIDGQERLVNSYFVSDLRDVQVVVEMARDWAKEPNAESDSILTISRPGEQKQA